MWAWATCVTEVAATHLSELWRGRRELFGLPGDRFPILARTIGAARDLELDVSHVPL